jgi:hypothetical protein
VVVFASTRDVKLLLLLNDMAVLLSLIFFKKALFRDISSQQVITIFYLKNV